MILTAITGSIGCGKTTISDVLREQGFLVYDIDKWVKLLYFKNDFLAVVRNYFPQAFSADGEFNKKVLRNLVFNNPDKLKLLENLIHPFLTKRLKKIIRKNKNDGLVFVDAALLFEMGWDKYFDYIIVADVDYEEQKKRVMERDNICAADFEKINRIQMPQDEKVRKADFVINTGGTKGQLIRNILCVIEGL